MTQRIILNDRYTNKVESDVIHEFDNGDTFKFIYRFNYQGYGMGQRVDLNSFDLTASYWIYGKENVTVDFIKSSISNNTMTIDPFGSLIKFVFKDYELGNGRLYYSLKFRFMDPSMPCSWIDDVETGFTGIILK